MIRTKTVITLGPASSSEDVLLNLIEAGGDVFRFNFSHGTLEEHGAILANVRAAAARSGRVVATLGDLCGPKIRIGDIANDRFMIAPGDEIIIQRDAVEGTPERLSCNYPALIDEVKPGHRLLIDDGNVTLRVRQQQDNELLCVCEIGGELSNHKGVNLPDSQLSTPTLTDKDRKDLQWAIENDLDFVALSFVRTPDDVRTLRSIIDRSDTSIQVISKIEKPEAIVHLRDIIDLSDAVLVARGDLGVEMDLARVPVVQKEISLLCRQMGKPVIIATQMLQSMVNSPVATRAEVSDVANAILDHADAVMLSAETSIGKYPVETIRTIQRIARETELFGERHMDDLESNRQLEPETTTAMVRAASETAREVRAKLIVAWTRYGNAGRLLSKHRPLQPIIALTPNDKVCRRMTLLYGTVPVSMEQADDLVTMFNDVDRYLLDADLVQVGDRIVVLTGSQLARPGETNALYIHVVGHGDCELPLIPGKGAMA